MLDIVHAAVMVMAVVMGMFMIMLMLMLVIMMMLVFMLVFMRVLVLMIVVIMSVVFMVAAAALFLTINEHRHVRAGDAAFHRRFRHIFHTRDPARIQFLNKSFTLFFWKKLEKRCAQHIACGAHRTVDVKSLHDFASIWLIILA